MRRPLTAVVALLVTLHAGPLHAGDPGQEVDLLAGLGVVPDRIAAGKAWEEQRRFCRLGHPERAIEALREAYRHGHPAGEVHAALGRSLLRAERPLAALHHLEQARQADPEDAELYLELGKAHSLRGSTELEIAYYQQALQLEPDLGEAHFLLALAYDKVGNSPKVLEHAQKAIRIDSAYKWKLKPRIKDSHVSRRIGAIVTRILEDSKFERLTDERIQEYADDIGEVLGRPPGSGFAPARTNRRLREVFERLRQQELRRVRRLSLEELPASPFAPRPGAANPAASSPPPEAVEEEPAPPEDPPEPPPERGFLR